MAAIPKAKPRTRRNGVASKPAKLQTALTEIPRAPLIGAADERLIIPRASDRFINSIPRNADPSRVMNVLANAFTGDLTAQSDLFERMEESWPRLAKNMLQIKQSVKKADWQVDPYTPDGVDAPSPEAQRKTDLIRAMLQGWRPDCETNENGFEDMLFDIVDAVGKGISVQELMWESRDGAILPRAAQWIHPRYYGYPFDSNRLHARTTDQEWKQFIPGKFLIASFKNRSGQTPIGYGLLRPLAWWWTGLTYGRTWLLRFAELFGVPFRQASYDPKGLTDARRTELETMMENAGSAGYVLTPTGTEFHIHDQSSKGNLLPQDRVHTLANAECDILLLGQTLTTDVADSGSRALGEVHEGVKDDMFAAYANFAADVINYQLIPEVIRQNFGNDAELPILHRAERDDSDPVQNATRDQILLSAGVAMPKTWFLKRHGIPVPEEGEEVIEQGSQTQPNQEDDMGRFPFPFKAKAGPKTVQAQLAKNVMEDLAGVSEKWLEPVKPVFERLVAMAYDGAVSDNDFEEALVLASEAMPQLFRQVRTGELQSALEKALGAAMLNGAVEAMRIEPK